MKTLFLLLLILGCSWVCSFGSSLLQSSLKRKSSSSSSSSSSLVFTSLAFGGEKIASSGSSNTALRNSLVYLTDLSPVANNIACTALGATAAVLWLQIWITLAKEGKVDPKLSRKIIHSGSAPLYLALFPLFSDEAYPNLFAAAVPLSQLIRLVLSVQKSDQGDNSGLVNAISRSGAAKEALQGPFYYNI